MKNVEAIAKNILYNSRPWWERVATGLGGQLAYFKADYMNRRIVVSMSDYGDLTITQQWDERIPQDKPITVVRLGEEESFKKVIPVDAKYVSRIRAFVEGYLRVRNSSEGINI